MQPPLTTEHDIIVGDARQLGEIATSTVELVVTSPPYPMIEMWDDLFGELNPTIKELLDAGDGPAAFEAMHAELDMVWAEIERVLVPGGIACVNIGDAIRKVAGSFRQFPNHTRIIDSLREHGFQSLPGILWHKPTNSPAKFMGSGTIPPNQYATLEHEHILVFRNGDKQRSFEVNADHRYESAYFWEERNRWFSDFWTDIHGVRQVLTSPETSTTNAMTDDENTATSAASADGRQLRERSAAYPFEIPYRLICMFSTYGDTVLDPFWGTGTTSLAAVVAARNSVGCEYNEAFVHLFNERVATTPVLSETVAHNRLIAHQQFVVEYRTADEKNTLNHRAANYDFPVKTKRERKIQLYAVRDVVSRNQDRGFVVTHKPVTEIRPTVVPTNKGKDGKHGEQATFQTDFK